jgi:hypothetical protein
MSQEDNKDSQPQPADESNDNVKTVTRKVKEHMFNVTRKRRLCSVMKETGNKKTACASVGLTPVQLDKVMSKDHDLYRRFKTAEADYLGVLEAEAKRRAVEGVKEDIYYKGSVVGSQQRYSDDLLKTLLKASDKDKYGTKTTVENNHNINARDQDLRNKLALQLGVKLEQAPIPIEDEAVDGEFTEG